jgi:predicted ATPase
MLLILDNCEHVLREAARLVGAIVGACPEVTILVTSREGLGIAGEQTRTVPSLGTPDGRERSASEVSAHDAVRLFVDRASQVRSGFAVDDSNAASVAKIVQQLDGIPLAIELAAARVRAMGPVEISAHLDERFRLLTGGSRTALERHQTLRGAVDWSYDLLSATEQAVFDRLSVFAGGFTLAAAQAVVADDAVGTFEVLECLTELVAKSMVVADDDGEGGVRYRLLETLRQYGRERLDRRGGADDLRRRHAAFFVSFAEDADRAVKGREELHAVRSLLRELDNMRVAFRWSHDVREADLPLRLVAALGFFGWGRESTGVHDWAVEAAGLVDAESHPLFGRACGWASMGVFNTTGDTDRAMALAERGIDAAAAHGHSPGPWPHLTLGSIAMLLGHLDVTERAWVEAAALARDDSPPEVAIILASLATAQHFGGRHGEAVATARQAADLARRGGNPTAVSYSASTLGYALATNSPREAISVLEEGLLEAERIDNYKSLAIGLQALGMAHTSIGNVAAALAAYRRGIELAIRNGDHTFVFAILDRASVLLSTRGHPEQAVLLSSSLDSHYAGFISFPGIGRREAIESARRQIGADRFERLEQMGAAMSFAEVLSYSRDAIDRALVEAGVGPDA